MKNPHEEQYDFLYKIVLVGDMNVGKTFLLSRYIKGQLPKSSGPTIGVEFATKTVKLDSGNTIKAQIWDTAGQERYRAITTAHYRRALGALLVYDVTQKNSFEGVKKWMEELRDHAEPDIVILLVGNKTDLLERNPESRQVSELQARQTAEAGQMLFIETSAVNGAKVKDAFELLLNEIFRRRSLESSNRSPTPGNRLLPVPTPKSSSCC
jgi:Rab family protein